MGIKDFELKHKMVFSLLNVSGPHQLVGRVGQLMNVKYSADQIERIGDAWRTWKSSTPQQKEKLDFLHSLVSALPTQAVSLTAHSFINLSYRELYRLVSEDFRRTLEAPPGGIDDLDNDVAAQYVTVLVRRSVDIKDIGESIREDSQIDHRHIYLSEESANRWYEFLHNEDYRQYKECVASLQVLLGSKKWRDCTGDMAGAVMLGAGTESKDRIIVDHLQQRSDETGRHFNYYVVDFSFHMLMPTVRGLYRYISGSAPGVFLRQPIVANFCRLPSDFPRISATERLVWFLPGGTLGNLQEDEFFGSISRVMNEGELLVIGVESTEGDHKEVEERLRKKYDTAVLRRFVSTPVRAHWSSTEMRFNLAQAIKDAHVDVVKGTRSEKHLRDHSKVPNALSVAISVPVHGQPVTVLFSTRYDLEQLIKYATAERFGFHFVDAMCSDEFKNYKQLVFERGHRKSDVPNVKEKTIDA